MQTYPFPCKKRITTYKDMQKSRMVSHWNIRIFPFYIQKHILINQINSENIFIYLYISILTNTSVSCKETDNRLNKDLYINIQSNTICIYNLYLNG